MALIKCKECGTEVSSKAESCPKCGARVKAKSIGCGTVIIVIILALIVMAAFNDIFSPKSKSSNTSNPTTQASTASVPPVTAPTPTASVSQWQYHQWADEMGKGTFSVAWVKSLNTVNFGFPYSGTQHGDLTLRVHPRHGKDVIFKIEKGQILCHSYDNCTVLVRFDDEKAERFTASGAADHSTETIFIQNYSRFMEKMLKAKKVRISVNIYQEGSPVFEFDVSNFDRAKYIVKGK
ncbi:MAG: zinc ribbon domain-containing protein [Syntrophaceae bacterium]|nr:zinc ribbon domain-containing protein [Syntrophaceae bacterium]